MRRLKIIFITYAIIIVALGLEPSGGKSIKLLTNSQIPVLSLNFAGGFTSGLCLSFTPCLTTTRASAETCTDVGGNITYATSGNPCITTAGIQVYGASSNVITNSQLLTTGWATNNAAVACGATAPDGTSTACTLTDNTTNSFHEIIAASNSAVTTGTLYTFSIYAKAGTLAGATGNAGSVIQIACNAGNALCPAAGYFLNASLTGNGMITNASSTVVNPGIQCWPTGTGLPQAGWCRVWFSSLYSSSATGRAMAIYMVNTPNAILAQTYVGNSSTLLLWGAQVNSGPLRPYIPTTTTAVSVPADKIIAAGSLATALQAASMFATFSVAAPPTPFGATTPGVILGTNTLATGLADIAGNQAQTSIGSGGALKITAQQFANYASNTIGLGCGNGGRSIVLNGAVVTSDANACGALTAENIGSLSDGTNSINGNILSISVYGARNDGLMKTATSNPAIALPVAAYTGEVANGTGIMNSLITANLQFNSRSLIHVMDNAACVQFRLPNYYVNISASGAEAGSGASAIITAGLEYPAGSFTQITFSSSTNGTIANNSELVSDQVCPSGGLLAYTNGYLRIFWTSATGLVQQLSTPIDAGNGEAMNQAASGLSDLTLGGTITQTGGAGIYRPTAIFSTTTLPTVCAIGDSRDVGHADTQTDTHGDVGEVARQVGTRFSYLNMGVNSDELQFWVANHTNRINLLSYCTNVITEFPVNDIYLGARTPAQIEANFATLWGLFTGKRIFQTTVMGETTSTDGWATSGNQTLVTNSANLVTVDDWIRTTPAPLVAYFENANAIQTSQDSLIWLSNGVGSTYTTDGIHETMYAYLTVKSFGGINLQLIQ